jgi:hypothetical protein
MVQINEILRSRAPRRSHSGRTQIEPMPGEPSSKDLRIGEAGAAPVFGDPGADVVLILDALGRMEATIRDDRATLGRLRLALGEMARAVARAKAAAPNTPAPEGSATATLLDELEHRIDAMLEIAGAAAPQPPAPVEPDQVPTVSNVVSQLGPGSEAEKTDAPAPALAVDTGVAESQAARPEADDPESRQDSPRDVPTVSMLKAMVEAMNAAAPVEPARAAKSDAATTPQNTSNDADEPAAEKPDAADTPRDPLAPLRAMSDDERLALFS